MYISQDIKDQIIELYYTSHNRINTILKKIAPNGEITVEDVYSVLNEYKAKNPSKAVKKERSVSIDKITDEELINLCEQGLSYGKIVEYYKEKGIEVYYATVYRRCREAYEKYGKEKVNLRNLPKIIIPENEIMELREQGLSYKKMAEYFTKKGIKVSTSVVEKRCKEIYERLGKEVQDLRRVEVSDKEIIELRKQGLSFVEMSEYFKEKGINITPSTLGVRYQKINLEIENIKPRHCKGTKFNDSIDFDIYMLRVRRFII